MKCHKKACLTLFPMPRCMHPCFSPSSAVVVTPRQGFNIFIRQTDTEGGESHKLSSSQVLLHAEIKAAIIWGSLIAGSIFPQQPYLACTLFLRYCCCNGAMGEAALEPGFYLQPLILLKGPEVGVSYVIPTTGLLRSV